MKIQPKRDILLIKVDDVEKKSTSGILIQEDWKTLNPKGTVLAVGPDVKTIKVGERVVFERYASVKIDNIKKGENINERLCQESHVLGTITDES